MLQQSLHLLCAELQKVETSHKAVKEAYLVYLSAYRTALAETEIDKLESEWTEVDQKWMNIRHWVQVSDMRSLPLLPAHLPSSKCHC